MQNTVPATQHAVFEVPSKSVRKAFLFGLEDVSKPWYSKRIFAKRKCAKKVKKSLFPWSGNVKICKMGVLQNHFLATFDP